jgi:hypothetical protein
MKLSRTISLLAGCCFLLACLGVAHFCAAQQTRAEAEKDPVLKAMLTELDRSMSDLQLKSFAKPFFIQYRVQEVDDYETKAAFGSSEGAQHNHARIARITVRVGDYKTDSSGGRGDGSVQLAALDDDPVALRLVGWHRPGIQERSGSLCAETSRVEAGTDSAAGRRLQQGETRNPSGNSAEAGIGPGHVVRSRGQGERSLPD